MNAYVRTTAATALSWAVGLAAAFGSHTLEPGWIEVPLNQRSPLETALLVGFAACALGAARVACSARAGALEAAAVLFFAHLPLAVVQLMALRPEFAIPGDDAPVDWLYARYPLHLQFTLSQGAALMSLSAGAVGLMRSSLSWKNALLVPLAAAGGMVLGGQLLPQEGFVLGGPLGLAAVVFPLTARGVRGPSPASHRSARLLAVLGVAMAVAMAAEFAWVPDREASEPYPYWGLWSVAEQIVYAHRVLLVRLAGCAAVLLFASAAGRPSRSSSQSALVALVGLTCLAGSATHVRAQRLRVFNWQWAHARELAASRLLCGCAFDETQLPTLGTPLPSTPLPWPLSGRVGYPTQRSVVPLDIELVNPPVEPVEGELARLRALPDVRFDTRGRAHPEEPEAREQQLSVPDTVPYGTFLRNLDRAVDLHRTHLHIELEETELEETELEETGP